MRQISFEIISKYRRPCFWLNTAIQKGNKMTKKLKTLLAAAAAAALVAGLCVFGCSSTEEESTEDDTTVEEEEVVEEETHEAVELQIFAANSLTKALAEVQELYTETHEWVTFADTQFKSSGELNSLLAAGSYADIEITASKGTMDTAEEEGYIDAATRVTMFTNDLVIVAAEDSEIESITLEDIATGEYTVAVGDDSVPAGNYANQALSTVGCFIDPDGNVGSESAGKANGTNAYEGTPLEGKVVTQTSVGNVCALAESGEVDVAFVYTSDVYRFGGVKIVGTVDSSTHKDIVYPGAVCAQSNYADEAQAFLDWCLTDEDAIKIWQEWGFELA